MFNNITQLNIRSAPPLPNLNFIHTPLNGALWWNDGTRGGRGKLGRRFEEGWEMLVSWDEDLAGGGSSMMDWRLDWVRRNGGWEFVLWCGKCEGRERSEGFHGRRWLLAKKGGCKDKQSSWMIKWDWCSAGSWWV